MAPTHRVSFVAAVVFVFAACSSGSHSGDGGDGAHGDVRSNDVHGTGDGNTSDVTSCFGITCASAGATCGPIGDGCGGTIDCGSCTAPLACGSGGTPSVCGMPPMGTCTPRTCASAGANCGPVADGCGNLLACGSCASGEACGGAGMPSVCGTSPADAGGTCTPRTCASIGANCGPVADGCGALLSCGTCSGTDTCGGGGTLSVCGSSSTTPPCVNLCLRQVACTGGASTTVTGTVYAPNQTDPLYNALVYVPNAAVAPFTPGVSCDRCGAPASGSPLVQTTSAADGTFTLTNVPTGAAIPLVIQLGRWRRQVTIPNVATCANTALPTALTSMPQMEARAGVTPPAGVTTGDIPLMAMVTGNVDTLECVLRKIGINDMEFTTPTSNGRVQFYIGNGSTLAGAPAASTLTGGTGSTLMEYDMVLFACMGMPVTQPTHDQSNLVNYTTAGGRVFATHYSYTWLNNNPSFMSTATWDVEQPMPPSPLMATVDTSFARGMAFAQWLMDVGASTTLGQVQISEARHDFNAVSATESQRWLYTSTQPLHYTFNTLVGADPSTQCGRVLFSDFHVANIMNAGRDVFPAECTAGPMTAQEHVLEFMLFDLASCVPTTGSMSSCVPQTCASAGANCGPIGDGCGNMLDCGTCTPPDTCGGGGSPSICGHSSCMPQTCAAAGAQCGPIGDGCGGMEDCGMCTPPATCGGGGVPSVCGSPGCMPQTCAEAHANCGLIGDGCGGTVDCGTCVLPDTCGGAGTPFQCGNLG